MKLDPDTIEIDGFKHVKYLADSVVGYDMRLQSELLYKQMNKRRSVREYADTPIPRVVIENLIKAASTAPSGANKQPWTFCAISDPDIKKQIREAAEAEEKISYDERMSDNWLEDLAKFATTWEKPFLTEAPWIIIAFKQTYELTADGVKKQNYYVNESIGLACGALIEAVHHLGLVTLTHTPSPMHFLSQILNRPVNEKPFLLLPVGYPKVPTYVPQITRKPLSEISKFY